MSLALQRRDPKVENIPPHAVSTGSARRARGGRVLLTRASAGLADKHALAERYAPVVRLVFHTDCPPGKLYTPIDVDVLFGDPTVALRGPGATNGSRSARRQATLPKGFSDKSRTS